jgi:flavodoxin
MKVLVLFDSAGGLTEQLAQAIADIAQRLA